MFHPFAPTDVIIKICLKAAYRFKFYGAVGQRGADDCPGLRPCAMRHTCHFGAAGQHKPKQTPKTIRKPLINPIYIIIYRSLPHAPYVHVHN